MHFTLKMDSGVRESHVRDSFIGPCLHARTDRRRPQTNEYRSCVTKQGWGERLQVYVTSVSNISTAWAQTSYSGLHDRLRVSRLNAE